MGNVSAENRRTQLIEAAIRVIQRDGIPAATTRAIASEADAPLASIHYTFGSKEEVIRAAFDFLADEVTSSVESSTDYTAGLEAAIAGAFERVADLLVDTRYAVVIADYTPYDDPWVKRHLDEFNAFAARLLERTAASSGEPTPAVGYSMLGRLTTITIDGVVLHFQTHGDATRMREEFGAMARALGALARERDQTPRGRSTNQHARTSPKPTRKRRA